MAAAPPPKPWERNRGTSAAAPQTSLSALSSTTSADNIATVNPNAVTSSAATSNTLTRPVPARPWERGGITSTSYPQSYGGSSYYGGGSGMYGNYGSSYMNSYGGMGSTYGNTLGTNSFGTYGRPMYGGGYGSSSMYSSPYSSFGSPYSSPMYSGMGGFGTAPGPPGMFDPNNPPAQPPTAWQHFLMAMNGALQFFSKICFLVDENTHAFHFFVNALLQLLDRAGSLYGELARFVLRLLRRKKNRGMKELEQAAVGAKQPVTHAASQALVPHNPWTTAMTAVPGGNLEQSAAPNWDRLWQN